MIAGRVASAASRRPIGPTRRIHVVEDCQWPISGPASVGAGRGRGAPRGGDRALLGGATVGLAPFRKIEIDPGTNSRFLDSRGTSRTRRGLPVPRPPGLDGPGSEGAKVAFAPSVRARQ